jgi:hypothetical protein
MTALQGWIVIGLLVLIMSLRSVRDGAYFCHRVSLEEVTTGRRLKSA